MVVGGSQQETMNPDFLLFDTRQQGVPVILRELVLPDSLGITYLTVKLDDTGSNLSRSTSFLKITSTPY
ncbi:unnamed protein product [Schistosoma margrebowiei]|uniref:Uncharacterized protein n=1 Tax=Schistosoma margrebowiei TaxID=48269 RepID=A0A183MJS2_9TREM|nr:unnamed protein product [Schistosoma margrebowiei]